MTLFADVYKSNCIRATLLLASIMGSAALAGLGHYEAAAALALALLISIGWSKCAAASPIELILIIWFVASPVASYYARLPADRSIVTFDRAVFCLLAAAALFGRRASDFRLARFEKAWALVAAVAFASAATRANNLTYALRIAFDSFALPVVAFHLARNYFDSNRMAKPLFGVAIAIALLLFFAGASELATGVDLFPYKGSELIREGQVRPNGPFVADSSYAIISLLLFVTIRATGDLLNVQAGDRGARIAYTCGLMAAGAAALLAAFRAVALALLLCLIIYEWVKAAGRGRARIWPAALVFGAVLTALVGIAAERAISPSNLYSRLAAWEAAARMAADHPLFGVGLGNYFDYYDSWYSRQTYAIERALSTKVAEGPHSNLLWIASELGLVGLIPYVAANCFLLFEGWRELYQKRAPRAALFAAYWVPGLALASGFYSDLNLYFFFLMGLVRSAPNQR
jgi:hypothetical protein